jgi:hypothetical protein
MLLSTSTELSLPPLAQASGGWRPLQKKEQREEHDRCSSDDERKRAILRGRLVCARPLVVVKIPSPLGRARTLRGRRRRDATSARSPRSDAPLASTSNRRQCAERSIHVASSPLRPGRASFRRQPRTEPRGARRPSAVRRESKRGLVPIDLDQLIRDVLNLELQIHQTPHRATFSLVKESDFQPQALRNDAQPSRPASERGHADGHYE